MATKEVYDVSDRPRYTFKKYPFISLLDDLTRAFLEISENVLLVKDIHSFIHCKIKSINDSKIH